MSEARNAGQREVDAVGEDDAGRTTRDRRARDRCAFEDQLVGADPKIIDDIAGRSLAGDEGVGDRGPPTTLGDSGGAGSELNAAAIGVQGYVRVSGAADERRWRLPAGHRQGARAAGYVERAVLTIDDRGSRSADEAQGI